MSSRPATAEVMPVIDAPPAAPAPAAWSARPVYVVIALLSICAVLPLFSAQYLPLPDLPIHAMEIALWKAYSTDTVVQSHFRLHLTSPYVVFYFLWRALFVGGLSLQASGRLAVALCVLAMPPSFIVLLKARRRPLEQTLFLFPFIYTDPFGWGFLPFYLSVPFLFCSLAIFTSWVAKPTVVKALLVVGSGLLILWTHALTVVYWGLACGLLAVLESISFRRRLLALIPLALVGMVLAAWTLAIPNLAGINKGMTLMQRLSHLGEYLVGFLTRDAIASARIALYASIAAVVSAAAAAWIRRSKRQPVSPEGSVDMPLMAAALAGLALYFFVPFGIAWTAHLNTRFVSLAFLVAVAALPHPPWPAVRVFVAAMLVTSAIGVYWTVSRAFATFDTAIGNPESLFASIPPKASIARPDDSEWKIAPFRKPILSNIEVWAEAANLGPTHAFMGNRQALFLDSDTDPWPRYGAKLDRSDPHQWKVGRGEGLIPDYLIFYSTVDPMAELPLIGQPGVFRFFRRSGHLYAYRLDRT